MTDRTVSLAAVRFAAGDGVDAVLAAAARAVAARGYRVAGYLQHDVPDGPGCCSATYLEDIASGGRRRITQALGPGSRGCRLDPQALADATAGLLRDIGPQTALVVLNRFGKGEAEGHGLRAVVERAVDAGLPVLTAVKEPYAEAWEAFGGGIAVTLEPDAAQVLRWCLAQLPAVSPGAPSDAAPAVS